MANASSIATSVDTSSNSIAKRNDAEFGREAAFYVGVFAAPTVVAVIARFAEERLGLLWRDSLTPRVVSLCMANGT